MRWKKKADRLRAGPLCDGWIAGCAAYFFSVAGEAS